MENCVLFAKNQHETLISNDCTFQVYKLKTSWSFTTYVPDWKQRQIFENMYESVEIVRNRQRNVKEHRRIEFVFWKSR